MVFFLLLQAIYSYFKCKKSGFNCCFFSSSDGPSASSCGKSSLWVALRIPVFPSKSCLNCWRKGIAWTNPPTARMNCKRQHWYSHLSSFWKSFLVEFVLNLFFFFLQIHVDAWVLARRSHSEADVQAVGGGTGPSVAFDFWWGLYWVFTHLLKCFPTRTKLLFFFTTLQFKKSLIHWF